MLRSQEQRTGFTLVEMLVVIGIMVVLAGLISVGVMRFMDTSQTKSARDNVLALHKVIQSHWDEVVRQAREESSIPQPVLNFAGGDAARARVIWIKLRLMEAFPRNLEEVKNANSKFWPYTSGLIPVNRRKNLPQYASDLVLYNSVNSKPETQSAACLLLTLKRARLGGGIDLEKMSRDTDNDGVPELIDNWGTPLAFYRFPDGSTELQNSNPVSGTGKSAILQDPLDPEGKLVNWPNRGVFEANIHKISAGTTPTYYIIPALISAGPDQQLGLDLLTMKTVNAALAKDNIESYRSQIDGGISQ